MPEELERDLGLVNVIAISMGAMIGSGIFILPGLAMAEAGPAVVLAFVIAGILVFPAALSIAELGTAMPEAGGDYVFIERGMGPAAGTIAGLGTWLMLMFKGALALVGGMLYLGPVFAYTGVELTSGHLQIIAVVVGVLLITINVIGVKQTGGLQNVLVLVMLVILGAFVGGTGANVEATGFANFFQEGAIGLFAATAMVLISYGGVTKVAAVAEEIERPGRNLPLGLLLSLVLTTLLYALIVAVLVGTVDAVTLAGSETPMVDGVVPFFGFLGVLAIVIAALFALISTANAGLLTASRYPFALSRDNLFPETFAKVSPRFRTPVVAVLTTGTAMILIILTLPVEEIAKTAGAFQIIVYILVCLALIAFRERAPAWYDPAFTAPFYPWVQVFGVVGGLFIITQMDTLPIVGGVGFVVLGLAWYWVYGRPRTDRVGIAGEALIETVEPPAEGADVGRIVVPIANPETERELMRVAAAIAADRDAAEVVAVNVISVPDQTALAQEVAFEHERIERQQALLDQAGDIAEELGVGLRVHAMVGRDVGETILRVIEREQADGVVMGWSGRRKRRERVLGSNIDQIVDRAPCEVTLVRTGPTFVGDVVAFVGEGPYSDAVVRQAAALVEQDPDATLTLVNLQETEDASTEAGEQLIESVVDAVDVDVDYDVQVVVTDSIRSGMIDVAPEYDSACLGITEAGSIDRLLGEGFSDAIGHQYDGTIVLVRDERPMNQSLGGAVGRRLLSRERWK